MIFGLTLKEFATLIFAALIPITTIAFAVPYLWKLMEGEEHERLKAEKEERRAMMEKDIQEYRSQQWDKETQS